MSKLEKPAEQRPAAPAVSHRQIAQHCGVSQSTVSLALRDDPRVQPDTRAAIQEAAASLGYLSPAARAVAPSLRDPAQERVISLKDIARACGVSPATVSFALRDDARVNPATRERILAVATELGYDAASNDAARRLISRRFGLPVANKSILLVIPAQFYKANFYSALVWGCIEFLQEAGYALTLVAAPPLDAADGRVTDIPETWCRHEVDGLLLLADMVKESFIIEHLRRHPRFRHLPIVALVSEGPTASSVRFDEYAGAELAARHLLALGHRHFIHYVTEKLIADPHVSRRVQAVRHLLTEQDIDPDTHLHLLYSPRVWNNPVFLRQLAEGQPPDGPEIAQAGETLLACLRAHPEITAVFARNDTCAIHLARFFQEHGIRVPEELSLVGFDDTDPLLDVNGANQLTTVRAPLAEIGRQAVAVILELIRGERTSPANIILPMELVVRKTTGVAGNC